MLWNPRGQHDADDGTYRRCRRPALRNRTYATCTRVLSAFGTQFVGSLAYGRRVQRASRSAKASAVDWPSPRCCGSLRKGRRGVPAPAGCRRWPVVPWPYEARGSAPPRRSCGPLVGLSRLKTGPDRQGHRETRGEPAHHQPGQNLSQDRRSVAAGRLTLGLASLRQGQEAVAQVGVWMGPEQVRHRLTPMGGARRSKHHRHSFLYHAVRRRGLPSRG